jgi:hypothetical protein
MGKLGAKSLRPLYKTPPWIPFTWPYEQNTLLRVDCYLTIFSFFDFLIERFGASKPTGVLVFSKQKVFCHQVEG